MSYVVDYNLNLVALLRSIKNAGCILQANSYISTHDEYQINKGKKAESINGLGVSRGVIIKATSLTLSSSSPSTL